jgi:hypothetical protein
MRRYDYCRTPYTMTYPLAILYLFSNLQRVSQRDRHTFIHLASLTRQTRRRTCQIFTRAHVRAKTRSEAHNNSTILSDTGRCWHSGKAPIHLCHSEWVLGLGDSPSVAHVVPALLVNYNLAYGCFPSCTHCPILRLGESCVDMLYWSTTSQLAG